MEKRHKTIIRIQKRENPYLMIDKKCINDERLSWKAKGILAYLLSKPDDWQVYLADLKQRARDGVKAVSSGMKELEKYGYVEKGKRRDKKGKFEGWEYLVYEKPRCRKGSSVETETPKSESGETESGKRHTTNKERTNKEITKKGSNQVATIRNYFIEQCKELKGFEPEMAFGKEGRLLKDKLKRYSVKQLKDLVDRFMRSRVGEDLGFTLGICLSAAVINQWLAGKLERPKKPTYNGKPMRKVYGKWQVFERGEWLEFADSEKKIIYV